MEKFDYYPDVQAGLHTFIHKAIEYIKEDEPTAKYSTVMNYGLHQLDIFAAEQKAEVFKFPAPFLMAYTDHETDPSKIKVKQRWIEGVWCFKVGTAKVFAANLSYMQMDYDEIYCSNCSFIIAPSKVESDAFLISYHKSRWSRNRQNGCVLNYVGERMEEFRKMQWDDIFLPNNTCEQIRNEIDTFFKSEKDYKEHGLDWKRGIILAGKPGNGKCVSPNTYVFTTNGMIRIGGIAKAANDSFTKILDTSISTEDGTKNISAFYNGGIKPCIRLKTRRGFTIEGTFVHPVRSMINGDPSWVKLGDIKQGDQIALVCGEKVFSQQNSFLPELPARPKNANGQPNCKFVPNQMTPKLAEWLGWFLGEGTYGSKEANNVKFTNKNKVVVKRMEKLTHELFGLKFKNYSGIDYTIASADLRRWLKIIGADGLAAEKSVPECILRSGEDCQRSFLRAIFEAEGCLSANKNRQIEFSSASNNLAEQVHLMLLNFGIITTLTWKLATTKRWGTRKYWRLLFGSSDAVAFRDEIGFMRNSKKYKLLDNVQELGWGLNSLPSEFVRKRFVKIRNLTRELGIKKNREFYRTTVFSKIMRNTQKSVMTKVVEKALYHYSSVSDSEAYNDLARELISARRWDVVESIELIGDQPVVDLTVPDNHSFSGNGISCHNTSLARAIATNSTVPVIYCALDSDDMFRVLDRVQRTIKGNAPCIVIFEDADSLASNPALRSAMLNMLDGLFTASGVLTIASTNSPEKLDEAFTGRPSRFDSYYVIGDPPLLERKGILLRRLGKKGKKLPLAGLKELCKQMAGLSAACVQEIAVCALLESLRSDKPISMPMLYSGLEKMRRHMKVSTDGLDKFTRGSLGFAPISDDIEDF